MIDIVEKQKQIDALVFDSNVFQPRKVYKPFEYNQFTKFYEVIDKTFWTESEIDFTADVNDFQNLSKTEQESYLRSVLSIAQIEVGVKTFWGKIHDYMPKPEINNLGAAFANNERIHSDSYAKLVNVNGLDHRFKAIMHVPAFINKQKLIEEKLGKNVNILSKIFFFIITIENASLFPQFANLISFRKFRGQMKNTANVVGWTANDESIHAQAGIELLNLIFEENPHFKEVYDQSYVNSILTDYIKVEQEMLDWIFENGELDWYSKKDLVNFMKNRINNSVIQMGYNKVFEIDQESLYKMKWFDQEIYAPALDDFFSIRPTDYTKKDKSITANDLF